MSDDLTVAEQRALEWHYAMQWLDQREAPQANSLIERLKAWRAQETPMSDDVLDANETPFEAIRAVYDDSTIARNVLDALSAAGLVVLRDPSGTARHGDVMEPVFVDDFSIKLHDINGPFVDDADLRAVLRRRPEGSEQ